LFLDAIEHFKLPHSGPVESMKRAILKVRIPRNTKILEISVTLHDPAQAQVLAQYIAEQTVKSVRDVTMEIERELTGEAQKQLNEARTRMEQAELLGLVLMSSPSAGR